MLLGVLPCGCNQRTDVRLNANTILSTRALLVLRLILGAFAVQLELLNLQCLTRAVRLYFLCALTPSLVSYLVSLYTLIRRYFASVAGVEQTSKQAYA